MVWLRVLAAVGAALVMAGCARPYAAVAPACRSCAPPPCPADEVASAAECFTRVGEPRPAFLYASDRRDEAAAVLGASLASYLASLNVTMPLVLLGGTGGSGSRVFARLVGQIDGVVLAYNTFPELDFLMADGLHYTAKRLESSHGDPCTPGAASDLTRTARAIAAAAAAHAPRVRPCVLALKHGSMLSNAAVAAQLLGASNVVVLHYVRDGRDLAWSANKNQLGAYAKAFGIDGGLPAHVQQAQLWARVNTAASRCLPALLGSARYVRAVYHDMQQPLVFAERLAGALQAAGVPVPNAAGDLAAQVSALYEAARYPADAKSVRALERDAEFARAQCSLVQVCARAASERRLRMRD